MKISIVTPVYNQWNFTKAYLRDLSVLSGEHEIIIVDNGSEDITKELHKDKSIAPKLPKNLKTIQLKENTGFAVGSNIGYKEASGDYIIFLNNDIRVKNESISWAQTLAKSAGNKLVGPTGGLLNPDFSFVCEANKFINSKYFYMSGWCLCAKKKTFDKLIIDNNDGPFSTEFGIAFFEDVDLSYRAKEVGISFDIVPIPLVHFGHTTAKKLGLNKLYRDAKGKFSKKWEKYGSKY